MPVAGYEFANEHIMEQQRTIEFNVQKLNDGLDFGEGTITGKPEDVDAETMARVDTTIETDPRMLVPVDAEDDGTVLDDDGCGDGRGVKLIQKGLTFLKRSLNRAKVFGGAPAMAVADRIGLGKAAGKGLNEVFDDGLGDLGEAGIDFGGHTDEHAEGENCGCGAVDKAPRAVRNVVQYKDKIIETSLELGVDAEALSDVMGKYESYAAEIAGKPYSGKTVMGSIIGLGKVVKKLAGGHREARIVLNTVEGHTVNQDLIRQVSGDKVQIFAVDVWRMQQLARRLHTDPRTGDVDEPLMQRSFVSQLVYTLGVAATLTKGDLPTYRFDPVPALTPAEA